MKIPHVLVLKELCSSQRTMTTARLSKELDRVEGQVTHKVNKMRDKYQGRIDELNARAQRAEALLAKSKENYATKVNELNVRAQKAEAELHKIQNRKIRS